MATLTVNNLIDEETGEVRLAVLKGLARREAMLTYGAITPRSLRSGLKMYADRLPELICAWRQRHGLPVETTMIEPFGRQVEGVRYSAF